MNTGQCILVTANGEVLTDPSGGYLYSRQNEAEDAAQTKANLTGGEVFVAYLVRRMAPKPAISPRRERIQEGQESDD